MSTQWFLARDNQRHGPYALDQLRAMVASGQLLPSDMLLQEGAQQWGAASSVPGVFPPPGVPPPPVPELSRQPDDPPVDDALVPVILEPVLELVTPEPVLELVPQHSGQQTTKRERPRDIADQLQQLQQLRESGALSDEEFAQAKQAVLSGTRDKSTREKKKRKKPAEMPRTPNAPEGQYRAADFKDLYMKFLLKYLAVVSLNVIVGLVAAINPTLVMNHLVPYLLAAVSGAILLIVLSGIFLYRAWAQIQDGQARTTPGKAVGYRFIPFFSLYWEFVAVKGLAEDIEHYARARSIPMAPIPQGLTVSYCIMLIVAGVLAMVPILGPLLLIPLAVLLLILFKKIADASAAIAEAKLPAVPAAGARPAKDKTVETAGAIVDALTTGLKVAEKFIDKGHH
jgi:hypothetical protein